MIEGTRQVSLYVVALALHNHLQCPVLYPGSPSCNEQIGVATLPIRPPINRLKLGNGVARRWLFTVLHRLTRTPKLFEEHMKG